MEQAAETNPAAQDPDVFQGSLAYMLGMSYFNKHDEFGALNQRLHKHLIISNTAHGLAVIKAKRDAAGALPNAPLQLVQPYVDMFYKDSAIVANGTVRAD